MEPTASGGSTWAATAAFTATNNTPGWEEWKYSDGRLVRRVWNTTTTTSQTYDNWQWTLSGSPTAFATEPQGYCATFTNRTGTYLTSEPVVKRWAGYDQYINPVIMCYNRGATGVSGVKLGYVFTFEGVWATFGDYSITVVDTSGYYCYCLSIFPEANYSGQTAMGADAGTTLYITADEDCDHVTGVDSNGNPITITTIGSAGGEWYLKFTMPASNVTITFS